MKISMIVAHGPNLEIGLNNKLLWHLKEDLQHFKKLTTGKIILMGRKTFESIGRPLPNRTNIILTRDKLFSPEGVTVIHDPEMLFDYVLNLEKEDEDLEVVICGGEEIYKLYLPYAHTLYRTLVDYNGQADAFFPKINESEWTILESEIREGFRFENLIKSL
jgi:dihydrofolate reductase